nr:DUF2244 domain-containing protein [Roseisalinus antarcticus]
MTPPPGDDAPSAELHLWPYRSLPRKGMAVFLGITLGLIAMPLLAVVGSPVLWGLLPFLAIAIFGVWWAIERSYSDGSVLEELRLWPDRVALTRHNPRSPRQDWEANPYWVDIRLHPKGGPVEEYLTLKGNGREVELGAFLVAEERKALHADLSDRLRALTSRP